MKNYQIIKTNMCMIVDGHGRMLVLNRAKSDWPGLTFPGGHLEEDETLLESVIREVKEETGLKITSPYYRGYILWVNDKKKICEIAYLFLADQYEGEIISSVEGEAFFVDTNNYQQYALSTDFEKVVTLIKSKD